MKVIGIIPARYASTRFPGKPLAMLGNKPVIQWVYERVKQAIPTVCVATDDERIASIVGSFGGEVVMTDINHRSGTDRCREALHIMMQRHNTSYDIAVNIQGDEPFIQPSQITSLINCFQEARSTQIATLVRPFSANEPIEALLDPNSPKVARSKSGRAIYFSREPIPHLRGVEQKDWLKKHIYYRHIGMYAFRSEVLDEVSQLPYGVTEAAESLEQLRWLEYGYTIWTAETNIATVGIDTPEDLEKAAQLIKNI